MPPIEENENPALDISPGSETDQGGTLPSAAISDTAVLPSESPTEEVIGHQASVTSQQEETPPPVVVVKRNDIREYLAMALEKINGKKAKKLAKILEAVEKTGTISNDQVEKILHCSDATATRYLSQLEKEGKITQSGKTGRSVTYHKT